MAGLFTLSCGLGPFSVVINAENDSGQSGNAAFSGAGQFSTHVLIAITPGLKGSTPDLGPQVASLYYGRCHALGDVADTLQPVIAGRSDSVVASQIEGLKGIKYALVVKRSDSSAQRVGCGNLP